MSYSSTTPTNLLLAALQIAAARVQAQPDRPLSEAVVKLCVAEASMIVQTVHNLLPGSGVAGQVESWREQAFAAFEQEQLRLGVPAAQAPSTPPTRI